MSGGAVSIIDQDGNPVGGKDNPLNVETTTTDDLLRQIIERLDLLLVKLEED